MTYTYVRNLVSGRYDIDMDYLIEQSKVQIEGNKILCHNTECTITFARELTVEEKTLLDSIVSTSRTRIEDLKTLRRNLVNAKTQEEEARGVPYNDHRFSITPAAKSNWLAVVISKDSLSYPFNAPTGFDDIYAFQSANDVLGFFSAAMSYITYWEQSNEQLIIAINACTTLEQLNAVVDDRSYPPS